MNEICLETSKLRKKLQIHLTILSFLFSFLSAHGAFFPPSKVVTGRYNLFCGPGTAGVHSISSLAMFTKCLGSAVLTSLSLYLLFQLFSWTNLCFIFPYSSFFPRF